MSVTPTFFTHKTFRWSKTLCNLLPLCWAASKRSTVGNKEESLVLYCYNTTVGLQCENLCRLMLTCGGICKIVLMMHKSGTALLWEKKKKKRRRTSCLVCRKFELSAPRSNRTPAVSDCAQFSELNLFRSTFFLRCIKKQTSSECKKKIPAFADFIETPVWQVII